MNSALLLLEDAKYNDLLLESELSSTIRTATNVAAANISASVLLALGSKKKKWKQLLVEEKRLKRKLSNDPTNPNVQKQLAFAIADRKEAFINYNTSRLKISKILQSKISN